MYENGDENKAVSVFRKETGRTMSDQKRGRVLYVSNHDYQGNYVRRLMEAAKLNPPRRGTVCHVSIAHDDWCDLLAGRGPCNCDPEVQVLGQEQ